MLIFTCDLFTSLHRSSFGRSQERSYVHTTFPGCWLAWVRVSLTCIGTFVCSRVGETKDNIHLKKTITRRVICTALLKALQHREIVFKSRKEMFQS